MKTDKGLACDRIIFSEGILVKSSFSRFESRLQSLNHWRQVQRIFPFGKIRLLKILMHVFGSNPPTLASISRNLCMNPTSFRTLDKDMSSVTPFLFMLTPG